MRLSVVLLMACVLSGCVQQRASVSIFSTAAALSVTTETVDGRVVVYSTGGNRRR